MPMKRSAPSTTAREHPPKKRAVIKGEAATKKSLAPSNPRVKARRKPVTIAEEDENDATSSEDENDEFPEGLDEHLAEQPDLEAMDVEEENVIVKDPNASRESHKIQKEMLKQRQAAKPNADLLADAKKHWSLARQNTLSRAEREKHVTQLLEAVRGKIQDLVFKHDASRVVQTIVKCGGQKEREEVGHELAGRYRELAQNKYAKFLVTKLLRYCPNLRSSILAEFHGQVLRLLLHREASPIIAEAYELYANAAERDRLLVDLLGKEVSLFQIPSSVKPENGKEAQSQSRGLKAALQNVDAERRKRVLLALKENLINIFNNPDKGAVAHAIVHRALWEYLQEVGAEEDSVADKKRQEIFESCQELVAEMVHTKEGSRAVREFLANGTAKDRKQIIKVLKPHIERMCKDDEAQLVLFTAFDVVDDTKLMAKSVVSEITQHARTFAFDSHKHGRRALLYLLVPRSSRHFPPSTTAILAETDAARARTSKKDADVREREIRTAASEGRGGLLHFAEERMDEMIRDPGTSLLLSEVLLYAEGDRKIAISSLVSLIRKTYPTPVPSNGELMHIIDVPHGARLIKTLVQGGHYNRSLSKVDIAPSWPADQFIKAFLGTEGAGDGVGKDGIVRMAGGNGAFIVAEIISRVASDESMVDERKHLKGIFDAQVIHSIEAKKPKGWDVLSEQLKKL